MEKFKEELFIEKYSESMLFETVSAEDITAIRNYIATHLGIKNNEKTFYKALSSYLVNTKAYDSLESADDLKNVLFELGLLEQTEVIAIWDYPQHINKFDLKYLIAHWGDIWFPPSDDAVCLFFPYINRAIMVTHWDVVYY